MTSAKRAPRARGNPEGSPWRDGGTRATRRRPKGEFSMPSEVWDGLEKLAAKRTGGNRSATMEQLVRRACADDGIQIAESAEDGGPS